jgi:hypothetical protein
VPRASPGRMPKPSIDESCGIANGGFYSILNPIYAAGLCGIFS